MEKRFDELAKEAAGDLSRRAAFWRIGGGLLTAALASLGLTRSNGDCGKLCAACCKNLDFPPRSHEHAQCVQDCHEGLGPCGPQVCPQ